MLLCLCVSSVWEKNNSGNKARTENTSCVACCLCLLVSSEEEAILGLRKKGQTHLVLTFGHSHACCLLVCQCSSTEKENRFLNISKNISFCSKVLLSVFSIWYSQTKGWLNITQPTLSSKKYFVPIKLHLDFAVEQLKLKVETKKVKIGSFFKGCASLAVQDQQKQHLVFDARRRNLENGGIQNSKWRQICTNKIAFGFCGQAILDWKLRQKS